MIKRILLIILFGLLFVIDAAEPKQLKSTSVIAILGAMEDEINILKKSIKSVETREINGLKFYSGLMEGRKVVLAYTGVCKVNAAMTTSLLIKEFKPAIVIFTGVAGGLNPGLAPGDFVIGDQTGYHDMGYITDKGFFAKGYINPIDGVRNPIFFPSDKKLIDIAFTAGEKAKFATLNTSRGMRKPRLVKGKIVTGDVFICSERKQRLLRSKYKADAVEMEGAAVAQVCYQMKIPFIIIRCISDNADENAETDMAKFMQTAVRNSAQLVIQMIKLLKP